MKLNNGLANLSAPLDSKIVNSRKKIANMGTIWELPGSMNQKDPKIPTNKGVEKYLINLFEIALIKE